VGLSTPIVAFFQAIGSPLLPRTKNHPTRAAF